MSTWLPFPFPVGRPLIKRKGRSDGSAVGKYPVTSVFLSLGSQDALLQRLLEIGGGICICDTHVKNSVRPFLPEVLH